MATALLGNLNETARSLFKQELLSRYLVTFVSMAARGERVTLVDGSAGPGRHEDGTPASAERILQAVRRQACEIDTFFVERSPARYKTLADMVAEYAPDGPVALPGAAQDHFGEIADVPLLLFVEPSSATFASLSKLLRSRSSGTEVLVDFTPSMVSRALRSESRTEAMSMACGGEWWHRTAQEAAEGAGRRALDAATSAVAAEYARRLSEITGMSSIAMPVHRRIGHRPVQHLVFATRSEFGLWVFAHTAARARQAWLRHLGELGDQREGLTLISDTALKNELIRQEEIAARAIITGNVRELVTRLPRFKLVQETRAVLGGAYGVATEGVIREVVTFLQASGELTIGQNNEPPAPRTRTRDLMVFPPPDA